MAQPGCRRMPILGRERTDGFGQSKCRSGHSLLHGVVTALAVEVLPFDDWFDAVKDGVRARVAEFIETMLVE